MTFLHLIETQLQRLFAIANGYPLEIGLYIYNSRNAQSLPKNSWQVCGFEFRREFSFLRKSFEQDNEPPHDTTDIHLLSCEKYNSSPRRFQNHFVFSIIPRQALCHQQIGTSFEALQYPAFPFLIYLKEFLFDSLYLGYLQSASHAL